MLLLPVVLCCGTVTYFSVRHNPVHRAFADQIASCLREPTPAATQGPYPGRRTVVLDPGK